MHGNFQGDVVTDRIDFSQMPKRLPGRRVKHRMKRNSMRLYNKEGVGLRVETVIKYRCLRDPDVNGKQPAWPIQSVRKPEIPQGRLTQRPRTIVNWLTAQSGPRPGQPLRAQRLAVQRRGRWPRCGS